MADIEKPTSTGVINFIVHASGFILNPNFLLLKSETRKLISFKILIQELGPNSQNILRYS
jgi:hypothetical protein